MPENETSESEVVQIEITVEHFTETIAKTILAELRYNDTLIDDLTTKLINEDPEAAKTRRNYWFIMNNDKFTPGAQQKMDAEYNTVYDKFTEIAIVKALRLALEIAS